MPGPLCGRNQKLDKEAAILENLVFQHNVAIANVGNKPTFIGGAGKCSTIIDVTFVSQQILPRVDKLMVLEGDLLGSQNDHVRN